MEWLRLVILGLLLFGKSQYNPDCKPLAKHICSRGSVFLSIQGKKYIPVIGQIDEVLHSSKFAINIHASVQNTDDLDLEDVFLPVKNHMGAGAHFSVAFPNQPFQGEKISIKFLNNIYKTNINSLYYLAPEQRPRFYELY